MSHLPIKLALACLLLGGCGRAADAAQASQDPTQTGPAGEQTTMMLDADAARVTRVPPPRADSVLYLISNVDGDGALSYPVANGATINFWHGVHYRAQGRQYYTGFAWFSPTVYGEDEQAWPDPGQQAVLAQATFVLDGNAAQPWRWEGSEPSIGRFGGYGRGNPVDGKRQPQSWPLENGDLLLAVPSTYDVPGATGRALEILHFSARLPGTVDDQRWRHLATLEAGSDNSAGCGDANPRIPCSDVTGQLRFVGEPGQAWPVIEVAFPEDAAQQTQRYRYDPQGKTYRPT